MSMTWSKAYHRFQRMPEYFIVVFSVLALIAHELLYFKITVDDVYISLTYARNLGNGLGLVHNQGLRVEGFSNLLWVLLVAPFQFFGLNLVTAAKLLGACLSILTLILMVRFLNHVLAEAGQDLAREKRIAIFLATFFLVISAGYALWSISGIEASLYSFLILASLLVLRSDLKNTNKLPLSPILYALIAMTRPEGIWIGLVALGWLLFFLRPRRALPRRWLLQWVGFTFLVWSALLIWRFVYFGEWLPNTVFVKSVSDPIRQILRGTQYIYRFTTTGGNAILLLFLLFSLRRLYSSEFLSLAKLYVLGNFAFILLSGGDWMPYGRFFAPFLPVLIIIVVIELLTIEQNLTHSHNTDSELSHSTWLTVSVFFIMTILSLIMTIDGLYITKNIQGIGRMDVHVGWIDFIKRYSRPGDTVAVVDAGRIGYETDLQILDMVGLLDTHIAHLPPIYPPGLTPGFGYLYGKWDIEYILGQSPAFIQMHLNPTDLANGSVKTDWLGTDLLLENPRFHNLYYLYSAIPEPLFIRKDIIQQRIQKPNGDAD